MFSELSERSITIAEGILTHVNEGAIVDFEGIFERPISQLDKNARKLLFVFCNTREGGEERYFELTERARHLGALCLKNDIFEVHKRLKNALCHKGSGKRITRYFLTGDEQSENVHQAILITEAEKQDIKRGRALRNLAIFASATGEANGIILDALNLHTEEKASYFVRRLNPALMAAYDVVASPNGDNKSNWLVDKDTRDRNLSVMVVGVGEHGIEIAKMLCWFYQRKKGRITVHLFDRANDISDRLRARYPGLLDQTANREHFDLVIHEGIEVFSGKFRDEVKNEIGLPDAAYITLGDDYDNAETAIFIRKLLGSDTPKIFAVAHNDKQSDNFASMGKEYKVSFVGKNSSTYAYDCIFNYEIEGKAIDKYKSEKNIELYSDAVNRYNSNEGERLDALSKSFHSDFIKYLYDPDEDDEEYKTIEEKRRTAYTIATGYTSI